MQNTNSLFFHYLLEYNAIFKENDEYSGQQIPFKPNQTHRRTDQDHHGKRNGRG